MAHFPQGCPLCRRGVSTKQSGDRVIAVCRLCGEFSITDTLIALLKDGPKDPNDEGLIPYLRCYIRQTNEQGDRPVLHSENWRDLARAHTGTPPSRKVTKFLEFIKLRSPHLGALVTIQGEVDYPLANAASSAELSYVIEHALELKFLRREGGGFRLTVPGWEYLEPVVGGVPGRCFVAMSFDPSLDDAYESGFYLGVKDCGFDAIRIDRVHHNEKICDKIIAELRQCQFMVADFTLQRAGVYFEAGFGMGLGRPVIWTCRKDDFENTHFDTRQYNHIVWDTAEDLREKLVDRIRATIPFNK